MPLEPGVNAITVFARVGEDAPTYRTIIVHREGDEPDPIKDLR